MLSVFIFLQCEGKSCSDDTEMGLVFAPMVLEREFLLLQMVLERGYLFATNGPEKGLAHC